MRQDKEHQNGQYRYTTRKWLAAAVVLTGAVALAGCGAGANTANTGNTVGNATGGSGNQTASQTTQTAYPLSVTDQAGHPVTIKKQPVRIASVTEGTDEILSGLVPKSDVVMVTSDATNPTYSNVVSWAKGIPSIAQANAEQVIAVHPDLALLATYTKQGVVQQIEQAGTPVYEFGNFNSIQDIENNIEILGKLVNQPGKAQQLVTTMQQKIAAVESAVKGQSKLTVLDDGSFGYAGGTGTTANDIIVDAGGINAAAKLKGWQKVTDEEIVKMNPDVIIDSSDDAGFKKQVLNDPALQSVSAVKNHRVYILPAADLSSVSQYIYKAVDDVAHALYPSVQIPQ